MHAIEETTTVQPDGKLVLQHPDLKPGDPVKVIVLLPSKKETAGDTYGFLKVLENAKLDGPPDWSENVEEYLHHGKRL